MIRMNQFHRKNVYLNLTFFLALFPTILSAQVSETEPNGMPDDPGIIFLYEDTQFSGTANMDADYWPISKSTDASGNISLSISNDIGVGATPLYLERRTGGYNGPVSSTITAHDGSAMTQFVSLDYNTDNYYVLRAGDMMQSGGAYNYSITGFNPASCVAPPAATAISSSSASSTSIDINTITGSGGDGYVVKFSDANSFTAPTEGFDLPTSEGVSYAGSGEQIVYVGDGSPNITITGLSSATEYYMAVYNYVDCSGYYEFASAYTTSESTCGVVPATATGMGVGIQSSETVQIHTITGETSSVNYVVKMNTSNSFTAPSDGALPAANTTYAGGEQVIYAGSDATPSELIDGLTADTEYFFTIYTASNCGGTNYFETTGYTTSLTTCNFTDNIASGVLMSSTSSEITIDSFNPLTTNGSEETPDGYIIVITNGEAGAPQNGTALPTADTNYTGGDQVVYVGNSTSPQIDISGNGLSHGDRYYFGIFAYYTSCGSNVYQQSGYYFSIEFGNNHPTATVTFDDISKVYGEEDFQLSATATSQIIYRLISQTGEGTSVSANTVTIGSPGTVIIEAQAEGNADSGFGVGNTIATLTIGKADPSLSFNQVEIAGQSTYNLSASTNSDGGITYSLPGTTNGHTLSGEGNSILNSSGTLGAVQVQVSAAESENFNAATTDGYFILTQTGATQLGLTYETIFRLEVDGTISNLNSTGSGLNGVPVFVNNSWWFVANTGGSNGGGAIMSYNESSNVLTNEYALDGNVDGTGLSHGLTLYQNKLWGVTDGGASGVGFFSYDPFTSDYELISTLSSPEVSQGSELLILNDKFYLGEKGDTDIIEIDPSDGSHSSVHTLFSGQLFAGIGLNYIDDKLMMATTDGSNDYIYAVDLDTQIGQTLATFGNSRNPSHVIDANGEIWGVNQGDSLVNEWGSVFSMDYNGSNFTTIHSFSAMNERLPAGKLSFVGNTIYGFTIKDGTNDRGAAFSLTTGGVYTKLGALTGLKPSIQPAGLGSEFEPVGAQTTFQGQTLFVNETITLSATSSSEGSVTYALSENDPTLSSVNGNKLTGGMAGMTIVFAYVAATSLYEADTVQATFTIERRSRNISLENLMYTYGDDTVKLDFNIPEGDIPNTYQLLTSNTGSSIIGLDGDSLVLGTPGTDQLRITAHESMLYIEEIYEVDLVIEKAPSSLAFPLIPMKTVGDSFILTDTTQQGLPVTYSSSNTAIANVSGHTVNVVGPGEVNITANVVGDALYKGFSGYNHKLTAYRNPKFVGAVTTVDEDGVIFINKEDSVYYLRNIDFYSSMLGNDISGHIILSNNRLWGMTRGGGAFSEGAIFSMETDSTDFNIEHDFNGDNGDGPRGGLVETGGNLWGMTAWGGDNGRGVIFQLDTTGANFMVMHHFADSIGYRPQGSLTVSNGKLWGTTQYSRDGNGAIFSIGKDGNDYTMVYEFGNSGLINDGESPFGSLVEYNGRLWGVTVGGGTDGEGTIFSIDLNGNNYQKHHDFLLDGVSGTGPHTQLTPFKGRLFGLAPYEGSGGHGSIFSIDSTGSDYTTEFTFSSSDGDSPYGWMTEREGALWGATNAGGSGDGGTIFKFEPDGSTFTKLAELTDSGNTPYRPLYTTLLPLFEEDSTQSVAFEPIADPIYGDTIIVNASASSGLDIELSSSDLSVATVNVDTIFVVGVGHVNITATQSGDSFWHAADSTISFTPQPRAITVTADPQDKTYGNADPDVLTYQITSGELINGDALSGSLSRVSGEDVGDYEIQQGSLNGSSYTLTYVPNNLTINPRPITVTADANQSKIYGESDPVFTYTITTGSLANGDGFSGALDRVMGEDVGNYEIQIGDLDAGTNYTLTYVSDNLAIALRPITLTATNQSKVYGNNDPNLNFSVTSGSLAPMNVFGGDLERVAGEDVGDYSIEIGSLRIIEGSAPPIAVQKIDNGNQSLMMVGPTYVDQNYDITFVDGTFSITPRPITITADDKSKEFGENDPSLTYSVTAGSLATGDSFSGILSRQSGNDVGGYAIEIGTLTIVDEIPAIAFGGGTIAQKMMVSDPHVNNYNLTFIEGVFTISKASQTITFGTLADQNMVENPTLTLSATASSTLPVSYSSSDETIATVSGNTVTFLKEGAIQITASQSGNNNYAAATDVNQDLNISELYIWSGGSWNSGSTPPDNKNLRFDGVFNTFSNDLIAASVEVSNVGELEIGANGGSVIVNGDLVNNGKVEVNSGGALVTLGSVSGTNYHIHRKTTFDENTGQYSIVGSPIVDADFSSLGGNAVVYGYDNSEAYNTSGNQGLDRFKTPSQLGLTEMEVGAGYFSAFTGNVDGTVTFVGTPNTGTINKSLDFTDHPSDEDAQEGFNLASNPYPSAISFTAFMTENSGADITGSIYLWDDNNSANERGDNADYLIVNAMGNTDSRNNGEEKWDGFIRSGQGFFVKANSATNIEFNNDMRVATDNDPNGFFRLGAIRSYKLVLSDENSRKATVIGYAEDATTGEDQAYDAYSLSGGALQWYSLQADDENKLGIQGLPFDSHQEVKLCFASDKSGNYTINLQNVEESTGSVWLYDHYTNSKIDLASSSYTFTTEAGTFDDRFTLHPVIVTDIQASFYELKAYSTDGWLHVFTNDEIPANTKYQLIDLNGRIILKGTSGYKTQELDINTSGLVKSLYLLKIQSDEYVLRGKVIVK